jgi:putative ABC transport system ATP-binding protein
MSNVILAQSLARCRPDPERVRELLAQLDIADKAHAFPRQLSFGQAQRVALARALINQPQIILADEPTSSLDDANAHRVTELLLEQASLTESVLVVASHDTRISNQIPHRLDLLASPGKP